VKHRHIYNTQGLRLVIAGGGTGGHIFPAVAVAQAIQKIMPAAEILFIGAQGKMEMEKVPKEGFAIKGLTIAGFNRSALYKNWNLPFKVLKSFWQVRKIFNEFKPTAVFGVGGYSSFPVLKYAQQIGIPSFIHESNSFAGKSNILLGKKATAVFTAVNGMDKFFPTEKITNTGNPIRASLVNTTTTKAAAANAFGLHNEQPIILSIGGSLGAQSINKALANNLEVIKEENVQLIWQTGKGHATAIQEKTHSNKKIYVSEFIYNMHDAFAAADLVISRAGAMAIAEIASLAKPSMLVPYPHAAEDHQTHNAQKMVEAGAAVMIADKDVENELYKTAWQLVHNKEQLAKMATGAKTLASQHADEKIAQLIIDKTKNYYQA
jgi:UDP-N-acetylglucosamine--N-acetylmuramyl-(pentapeptide) pyrophosphoryl-undecaprenol N-acetylglucosamine transferase